VQSKLVFLPVIPGDHFLGEVSVDMLESNAVCNGNAAEFLFSATSSLRVTFGSELQDTAGWTVTSGRCWQPNGASPASRAIDRSAEGDLLLYPFAYSDFWVYGISLASNEPLMCVYRDTRVDDPGFFGSWEIITTS
jgi:hypothetical protein